MILRRIAAYSAALILGLSCAFTPISAFAAPPDENIAQQPEPSLHSEFSDTEEAGVYLREQIKRHAPRAELTFSGDYEPEQLYNKVMGTALAETGKSDEGEYLRLSIGHISVSFRYNSRLTIMIVELEYNYTLEQELETAKAVRELLDSLGVPEMKDDYSKISAVYSYITHNVKYVDEEGNDTIFSAYGALVNHKAVCQGYIQAIYRLFMESGISCRAVMGTAYGGNHVWCMAAIDDVYYLLDPTWESTAGGKNLFFLKGTDDFDEACYPVVHTPLSGDPTDQAYIPDTTYETLRLTYNISATAFDAKSRWIKGDVNADGIVDVFDIMSARKYMLVGFKDEQKAYSADIDESGSVKVNDFVLLQKYLLSGQFIPEKKG